MSSTLHFILRAALLIILMFPGARFYGSKEFAIAAHRRCFTASSICWRKGASDLYLCLPQDIPRRRSKDSSLSSLRAFSDSMGQWSSEFMDETLRNASPDGQEVEQLVSFLHCTRHLVAITGAGISTPSGIPDYRGPLGSYKRGHQPITHQDFVKNEESRKRYWARSSLGWRHFSRARPNAAHYSLAQLEDCGVLKYLVTQNVDRLHQSAGSLLCTDLHGRNDRVQCLHCGTAFSRRIMQQTLEGLNPSYTKHIAASSAAAQQGRTDKLRADGDIEVGISDYSKFVIPSCSRCGGVLKPDVVMFGDNVPVERVAKVADEIDRCDAVLIVGTSLEVFSAYRFILRASKRNVPLAIVNYGDTRAERQNLQNIVYRSSTNCAVLLQRAVKLLCN